jgi:tetratricopeptide (TPR) repeat protein
MSLRRANDRRPWAVCGLGLLLLVLVGCSEARKHISAGNHLYNAGKFEEAAAEYERALELKPGAWVPAYRAAISYVALFKPQSQHPKDIEIAGKARVALERCLALEAPSPEERAKVRDYYVGLLTKTGDTEPLIKLLEDSLAQDPKNTALVQQLANLHAQRGDFPNALRYFMLRTELDPNNAEAWYTLGVVCWERSYHQGDLMMDPKEREEIVAQGLAALDRAIKIKPDSFDVLAYLNLLHRERAKTHKVAGRLEEAAKDLATANEFAERAKNLQQKS